MNILLHWKKIVIILTTMIVVAGLYTLIIGDSPEEEQAPDISKQTAELFQAGQIVTDTIITTTLGTVQSIDDIDLRSEASGRIVGVYAGKGDVVNEGQVILELDRQVLDAQVQQAEARLSSARATLEKMKNGDRPEDLQILQQRIAAEEQRLAEMQRGGRDEEVEITKTQLSNAYKTLEDARKELANAEEKADRDVLTQKDNALDLMKNSSVRFDKVLSQHLQDIIYPIRFPRNETCELSLLSINDGAIESKCLEIVLMVENHAEFADLLQSAEGKDAVQLLGDLENTKARAEEMRAFLTQVLGVVNATVARDTINGGVPISDEELTGYKTSVTTAQNEIEGLITELTTRIQGLRDQELVNKTAIDAATSRVTTAENNILSLEKDLILKQSSSTAEQIAIQQSQIEQLKLQLKIAQEGARPEDIQGQVAAVQQAQADVAVAVANRNKAILTAPISGTIVEFPFQRGDFINTSDMVAIITNPEQLEIIAFLTEEERKQVTLGTEVRIADTEVKGYVERISPALQRETKKIEVSIDVYEGAEELVIGQTLFVGFELDIPKDALRIPLEAVQVSGNEAFVYSVNKDKQITAIKVVPGQIYGDTIVVSGITSDRVILADTTGFEIGEEVDIKSDVEIEEVEQLYPDVINRFPELKPEISPA